MNTSSLMLDVRLSPAAAAVWRQPSLQVTPQLQSLLLHVQLADMVVLPPCNSTFVVVFRTWTIQRDSMTLQVTLDLASDQPTLTAT